MNLMQHNQALQLLARYTVLPILNVSTFFVGVFDPEESEYETTSRFILDGEIDDEEALVFFAKNGQPPWILNEPDNNEGVQYCVMQRTVFLTHQ